MAVKVKVAAGTAESAAVIVTGVMAALVTKDRAPGLVTLIVGPVTAVAADAAEDSAPVSSSPVPVMNRAIANAIRRTVSPSAGSAQRTNGLPRYRATSVRLTVP